MQEIKCPNCGKTFQLDETGYTLIAQQVRDKEFEKELDRREHYISQQKESSIRISRMQQEQRHREELLEKDSLLDAKESELKQLRFLLEKADTDKELAVLNAVQKRDKELSEKGSEIARLKGELELQEKESALREKSITEQYEEKLKLRDEKIEQIWDYQKSLSTKMVGESLEQHCLTQFNQIRMAAFPNAYFEKDNDAKTGSKGDFIFKEEADGVPFISIMFEMKNEMDTTATKHKNEDFFKELDKDRREKGCEYAVLVSLLERDSDLYNSGIVDVSYRYPKMYVVRPMFFIPIISLLRNAAMNSLYYRKQLQEVQNRQLDLSHFEDNLTQFKNSFAYSLSNAADRYSDAIKGIDSAIATLNKIKENLQKSEKHLISANNKLEDVTIKKLTKNAPSVRAMLEDSKK